MGTNRCLFCYSEIPEGRMICPICEQHYTGTPEELKKIAEQEKRNKNATFILDNWIIPVACLVAILLLYFFGPW